MIQKINGESVFEEIANNPKEIVVYGAGRYGRTVKKYLETIYDANIKYFVVSEMKDNTERYVDGIEVIEISEIKETDYQLIIAISEQNQNALLNTAIEYGFKIVYLMLNEMIRYMESRMNVSHLQPLEQLNFEVHVTEHCNLNCKGCYHFSPLSEEIFLSIEEFDKDIEQMKKLCDDRVSSITLLGGEPLLHPQISDFFAIIRKYFPKCRIKLLTNGVLLPKMNDQFWESCFENRVSMFCTKYPISVDYKSIEDKANRYSLKISYHNDVNAGEKTLIKYPFDITGGQPIEWNYENCTRSNKCITLKNGRLFTCPMAAHAHIARNYFDLDLELSEKDSIDIYRAESFECITDFLTKPIPFCRYCNLKVKPEQLEWATSKKIRSEWF